MSCRECTICSFALTGIEMLEKRKRQEYALIWVPDTVFSNTAPSMGTNFMWSLERITPAAAAIVNVELL
ncbi:predicted protein [Sclerotinia sclerotiorum 1980 UF-70]|uniref:Uncharacterized protein n=1 Tax=Sclerotinia sclerotiorum (strain ATCC 18683 / 1980 / Ss-1) TaxID=665079 RepID=A7EZF1_SCLS1|nr:predicted protein [Sclerotinia sclerotiorum 1980 UF-70]EDN94843.1 predicted protein [Sclerotinia sclerotiorum 1980 UF-70]